MTTMLITSQGLVDRIISKNEMRVWCGWGAIPTKYNFFVLEGRRLQGQKSIIEENTRNEGIFLEEVPLDKDLLLEDLKTANPGQRLYYFRDNNHGAEGEEIAIRTKDGWKVHRSYLDYWK